MAHVVESLKHLATDAGVPVMTASQLNDEGRVRESRAILNTANILIRLRPDMRDMTATRVDIDLNLDKCRGGGHGYRVRGVGQATLQSPDLNRLHVHTSRAEPVGDRAAAYVRKLPKLGTLFATEQCLTDALATALREVPVRGLVVDKFGLTDQGIDVLKNLPALTELCI